jgi:excisionase family DNA binding protein
LTEDYRSVKLGGMELLSTRQAAAQLGISTRRVRMLIAAGALRAQQLGREWIIEAGALDGVQVYGKPGRPPKPVSSPRPVSAKNDTATRGRKGSKKCATK